MQNFDEIETFLFDYGGVVAFHYCEPWHGNLSELLKVSPTRVRQLLSETSEQGKNYRLGEITREQFWSEVMDLAGSGRVDISALEENWARSYQLDQRMLPVFKHLKNARKEIGIIMNTDMHRHTHIENEYALSSRVDVVISSCIHKVVKPEKDAYLCALRAFNKEESPHKVAYFDDRERNIAPCSELGMQGILFKDFDSFFTHLQTSKVLFPPKA